MHTCQKPRILTVDDDRMILAMLAIGMREAGYEILQASSAEEALEMIADNPPDLAVLDISMPGMSGIELAQYLRSDTAIPFIFLSSHTEADIVREATQNGAVGYLVKPINVANVIPSIEAGLARAAELRHLRHKEMTLEAQMACNREQYEKDVLRRKQIETELLGRYTELTDLNLRLDQVQERLLHSEKLASIGQLAAGIAHEINNPIGYLQTNIATLETYTKDLFRILDAYACTEAASPINAQAKTEPQRLKTELNLDFLRNDVANLLAESKDGLQRMRQIVHDMKDFSRSEINSKWESADLHAGLDSTINMGRNEIKYKAEVIKEFGPLPLIECHPAQLNQVFMNILVNAAQSIEEGDQGTIVIRTGVESDQVWIEISDTGCGIPSENQKRIFNPFFTTKPTGQGTGLGLSISTEIIQKHRGTITVKSGLGEGTTFRIVLPQRQS